MSDLHDHIYRLATLGSITPRDVGMVLGVSLLKDRETPYTEIYRGGPSDDLTEVTLKLFRNSPAWLVSWDYDPAQMPIESQLDLSRYGRPTDIQINPRIPPEGTKSLIFDYMGFKLIIEFMTTSGRLRGAALHKD